MATITKSLSVSYMSVRYGVTEKTARLFMLKVREVMVPGGKNPMDCDVHVDEFVLGGKDQGKPGRRVMTARKKSCHSCPIDQGWQGKAYVRHENR